MNDVSNLSKQSESRSAISVNLAIFKLVETIEKKIKAGHADKDLEELKLLREECGSEDPLVSVTACHGLVYLVKSYLFPLPNTISTLVASLFSVKSVTGVTSALTELLILELKTILATEPNYSCPYNTSKQHPLVSVLKRRPQAWPDVLNQVTTICTHPDKQVHSHSLELVKPVMVYVLTEARDLPSSCRQQAIDVIVEHFSDTEFLEEALASCLCWEDSRVLEAVQVVSIVSQSSIRRKHGLHVSLCCLSLAALVPRLLRGAHCPLPAIRLLTQLAASATNTHSTLLALLAPCVSACPPPYLNHLLTFFVELLRNGQCSLDCVWMCVAALLPWLTTQSAHLQAALHTASSIVSHATNATSNAITTTALITNPAVATIVSADHRLTQAVHIARLSEVLRSDAKVTVQWLQQTTGLDQVYHYVSALLLSRSEWEVRLAALQALTSHPTPPSLTLLLYQLARETQPEIQLALLRALPTTAVDKSNVLAIISTLEALRRSGHQVLSVLAIDLYCQLWAAQERCYPQLMETLSHDVSHYGDPWIANMLQANICKIICDTKPEMHGKEVVAVVSALLNKCGGVKDAAAAALALAALVPLCRHDVVDVYSIWRSLAPRFSRDKRPLVICSLCELASVAAVQKCSADNKTGLDTLFSMLQWLWNLVGTSKQEKVIDDALKALSKIRLDHMKLKMLPECFRKGLKLPPEMAKTPVDAARKPEDVLEYIPGECWVQVLQHVGSEAASLAIASWMKMELASSKNNSLYQVDRQEPVTYAHLPHNSVIRGVTTSLQQLCKADDNVKLIGLCLVVLQQPSPKPLPCLNWSFLESLTDPTLTQNVIRLSAKQSQISPSARKITENYIKNYSHLPPTGDDFEKVAFLFSILPDLCRGIPPVTLRPFLQKTLQSSLSEKNKEQFSTLLGYIKATLQEEKIHDANRTLLHQQLKCLWDLIEPQNESLSDFFACVSELPLSMIESMTSSSLMWEVTSTQLQKAFRLRAFMALLPNAKLPLNWVNEIIEDAAKNISEQSLALQLLTDVMNQLKTHPTAWPWLLELMGQIHATSIKNESGVDFLICVFLLCVDIISGYSSLAHDTQDTRPLRLPQAVAFLVAHHGETKTVLEWLNHIRNIDSFPAEYLTPFQLAARNVSLILL